MDSDKVALTAPIGQVAPPIAATAATVPENSVSHKSLKLIHQNKLVRISESLSKVNLLKLPKSPNVDDNQVTLALQEINNTLESLFSFHEFSTFYRHAISLMLNYLSQEPKTFILEHTGYQIRKLILEIIHRFPFSENRHQIQHIFPVMYDLIENDNEDNAATAMKILTELHKKLVPHKFLTSTNEIIQLLGSMKRIVQNFLNLVDNAFSRSENSIKIEDMSQLNVESLLNELVYPITVNISPKPGEGNVISYKLLPLGMNSMKMIIEIAVSYSIFFQLYKNDIDSEINEIVPLAMKILLLNFQVNNPTQAKMEIFNEFIQIQSKFLSFLALVIHSSEDRLKNIPQWERLPEALFNILKNCPNGAVSTRRELLFSFRHFLSTKYKVMFISHLEKFMDDSVLVGTGWTTREVLRPHAYTITFDLLHHLRDQLDLRILIASMDTYSKILYDESVPLRTHLMTARLLCQVAESCCRVYERNQTMYLAKPLLMKLFECYASKVRVFVKIYIPVIKTKVRQAKSNSDGTPSKGDQSDSSILIGLTNNFVEPNYEDNDMVSSLANEDFKLKFGLPEATNQTFSMSDFHSLIRTIMNGLKVIAQKLQDCSGQVEPNSTEAEINIQKRFRLGFCRPQDVQMLISLFKYGLRLFEFFPISSQSMIGSLSGGPNGPSAPPKGSNQAQAFMANRAKDEKELMDYFVGIFKTLSPQTFRVVMLQVIDTLVQSHQHFPNTFHASSSFASSLNTSSIFNTILIEYLLERMEQMGVNSDLSNLYLRLFKQVFQSVQTLPNENQLMLKPYLHSIVNNSILMALTAKEPYNYFILLRALFRSIGGGAHDLLYQEFLPMLPTLLQSLNSFQTGIHRQNMKDLFVELCLTIPVRLSSLLPYLPWLMDPLVSALNGTQNLIAQGLRTLELCVDNLQPDFLYEHIQPIRTELMQALWRTLRNQSENISVVAFRILGKFGGANHRQMIEPQKLNYIDLNGDGQATDSYGVNQGVYSFVSIQFNGVDESIELPLDRIIEAAYKGLCRANTDSFCRHQCLEVIKGFFVVHIQVFSTAEERQNLCKFFKHSSFLNGSENLFTASSASSAFLSEASEIFYKMSDEKLRKVHELALTAMLTASAIKELRSAVFSFMIPLVRYYSLCAISQQAGPIKLTGRQVKLTGMDPLVLIDATVAVMGQEDNELCKPGNFVLRIIFDTAVSVLGSKERACHLPLFEYILERLCCLCYERPWYFKYGGCIGVRDLFEQMSTKWLLKHQFVLLKAMFFVIMDLSCDLSSGVIEMAKENLEIMVRKCSAPIVSPSNVDIQESQRLSIKEVVQELLYQVTSPHKTVRDQAVSLLKTIATSMNCTVSEVIRPQKDLLADMVPPKKHHRFLQQPLNVQIGILDGNTFCMSLEPKLYLIDMNSEEHASFFNDVLNICLSDDSTLSKLLCYKKPEQYSVLRKSALQTLGAWHYVESRRKDLFEAIYKTFNTNNLELVKCAFECLKHYKDMPADIVQQNLVEFMQSIDFNNLTLINVEKLTYLAQLFPNIFGDPLFQKMLNYLSVSLDSKILKNMQNSSDKISTSDPKYFYSDEMTMVTTEVKICSKIITMFSEMPVTGPILIERMLNFIIRTELNYDMYVCQMFYPAMSSFFMRFPAESIKQLEARLGEPIVYTFFVYLLRQQNEAGSVFRATLKENPLSLINQLKKCVHSLSSDSPEIPSTNSFLRFQQIQMVYILMKDDANWISAHPELVACLKAIWNSEVFHQEHFKTFALPYSQWNEPKYLGKCLIKYIDNNREEYELLFSMLRAFNCKINCNIEFMRKFLIHVSSTYSVEWKRKVFIKFIETFSSRTQQSALGSWTYELKGKVLQYLIIPIFLNSFENKTGDQLIGPLNKDQQQSSSNNIDLVSLFLSHLITEENRKSDFVHIPVLQLGCILVEYASHYIRPMTTQAQSSSSRNIEDSKVRTLMQFVWPCLLEQKITDPCAKYYGHLLLAHIISKFAIHKRIVRQVFSSLLKGSSVEARMIVRNAMEILTLALPHRIDERDRYLVFFAKKLFIEDGLTVTKVFHTLQLVIRYYQNYYEERCQIYPHLILQITRLAFPQSPTVENRKIALDIIEVIVRWEHRRLKDERKFYQNQIQNATKDSSSSGDPMEIDGQANPAPTNPSVQPPLPLEKEYAENIILVLTRLVCTYHEMTINNNNQNTPSSFVQNLTPEYFGRRSISLLRNILKSDIWPYIDFKLVFLERVLASSKDPNSSYQNVVAALELLVIFLETLKPDIVLKIFKSLQKAIAICCTCTNAKVVRTLNGLLTKLMSIFPPSIKSTGMTLAKQDQLEPLEQLYTEIHSIILNGFGAYEKAVALAQQNSTSRTGQNNPQNGMQPNMPVPLLLNSAAVLSQLFGTLMILKAACVNHPSYIDRLLTPFIHMLQKLVREHMSLQSQAAQGNQHQLQQLAFNATLCTEIITLSLDLIKNRIVFMSQENRRLLIQNVFLVLIDKSPEAKIMKSILKMFDEWIKQPIVNQQGLKSNSSHQPIMREKSVLLIRISTSMEKNFADNSDLYAIFLDLIYYIYLDDTLKFTDLATKLEQAFMAGLKSHQPQIRNKFFQLLDSQIPKQLFKRIMYIACEQNWNFISQYYWIKICVELALSVADPNASLTTSNVDAMLPLPTSQVHLTDQDKSIFSSFSTSNEAISCTPTDMLMDFEFSGLQPQEISSNTQSSVPIFNAGDSSYDPKQNLLECVCKFLSNLKDSKSSTFLHAVGKLCQIDPKLAHHVWIQLFPRIFKLLEENQKQVWCMQFVPFILSGSHRTQIGQPLSSIGTFFEAFINCKTGYHLNPLLLKYLSKNHNLWHLCVLMLESMLEEKKANPDHVPIMVNSLVKLVDQNSLRMPLKNQLNLLPLQNGTVNLNEQKENDITYDNMLNYYNNCTDSLAGIYETLKEEDYWAGVWHNKASYKETLIAIAYEQMGFFERAKGAYELANNKCSNDYPRAAPYRMRDEIMFWGRRWIRCIKELNQWDFLLEYGIDCKNPILVLETAWRIPEWDQMNLALNAVESNMTQDIKWKIALYKGYNAICNSSQRNLDMINLERLIETSSNLLISQWRKLPHIVSMAHIEVLHAAHQITELNEAANLQNSLFSAFQDRSTIDSSVRAILKTWKNRLPILADDLSHWSDIFTWRQHHFQTIVERFEPDSQHDQPNHTLLLASHYSAFSLINYAKIARKHSLINVSLDSLNRIHTIPKVPIMDCFFKIKQQLKCQLSLSKTSARGNDELKEGLAIIESANLNYFMQTRDMLAELYALIGHFKHQLDDIDGANESFSSAVQINNQIPRPWALWAEFNEELFTKVPFAERKFTYGKAAVLGYLHASRVQSESKSIKYLSRMFWLLSYDDDQYTLTKLLDKFHINIPNFNWLPWVSQLLCSMTNPLLIENPIVSIILQIGRAYPQAVYFPLRKLYTLYRSHSREMKSKYLSMTAKNVSSQASASSTPDSASSSSIENQSSQSDGKSQGDQVPPNLRIVTYILHQMRDQNPTILTSLEGMIDQFSWFHENFHEEVLRQLKQALIKCYTWAFEKKTNVAETNVSPQALAFLRKIFSSFDAESNSSDSSFHRDGQQSSKPHSFRTAFGQMAQRAQATSQDPMFLKLKSQFNADFDFINSDSRKLHNIVVKLKKWIKVFEAKVKVMPKSWLLEEKCRFLSNFCHKTAKVFLPGEYLLPKHGFVHISRFMPRVELVNKHNTVARRIHIRGHNGRIYPYLILMNETSWFDNTREERLLQMLRLLNTYLTKHKETARRLLYFTIPKIVSPQPQMRIVEDNPSSLSLIDIYKQHVKLQSRGRDPDAPIAIYYDRLLSLQNRGQQATTYALKEIITEIQNSLAPKNLFSKWAHQTFADATEFWHFRKLFTQQLGLSALCEFAFFLTRLNPDMMYIHRDTGLMNVSYFRFDLSEDRGELSSCQVVPFRLTHSLSNFITDVGINGPLTATLISTATCLAYNNYKIRSVLKAILRDEIIWWYRAKKTLNNAQMVQLQKKASESKSVDELMKSINSGNSGSSESTNSQLTEKSANIDKEELINLVTKASNSIMTRLQSMSSFEGTESKVATLIATASNDDNLCRMDPAWHPWL